MRPVVLVHGFIGSAATWSEYLGPEGYLARIGRVGFALGEDGFGFPLDMGGVSRPAVRTSSIEQNAQVLADAIEAVRVRTGAASVDVVAHSMGGLVARYYVAKLMRERDVGQLILLGTPHGGSACAALPAALGFYLPASLELRRSHLVDVFNVHVADLRGVPLATLAGTAIQEAFRSPCTGVPSDLVVDLASATAAGGHMSTLPLLHTDLNSSDVVFEEFVAPLLVSGGDDSSSPPPPLLERAAQATHVYSGVVTPGNPVRVEIDLDAVAVASFALFDPSVSLDVRVTGASGAVIPLTAADHGLTRVGDPAALVHLGYGFASPRPGAWNVDVLPTLATPATGAPFALMASVVGGSTLSARVDLTLPAVAELVTVTAEVEGVDVVTELVAVVTRSDGATSRLVLTAEGAESGESANDARVAAQPAPASAPTWSAGWRPEVPGPHGVDVVLTGVTPEGLRVERSVPLFVDVQAGGLGGGGPRVAVFLLVALALTAASLIRARR
jgi:pimeloyl-ACP methyl ester carboxylesterase